MCSKLLSKVAYKWLWYFLYGFLTISFHFFILLSQFIIEVAVDMLNLPHIYFSFIHAVGVMQKCVGVSFVCISCYAIVHFLVILDRAAV